MSVVMNEGGLRNLLVSAHGPVGLHVETLAKRVAFRAYQNATAAGHRPRGRLAPRSGGPFVRTGDLSEQLKAYGPFFAGREGSYWHVGSIAVHEGINYPRLIEMGGFAPSRRSTSGFMFYRYPYLIPALAPDFVRVG